jgi:hypothetical protein
MEKHKFQVKIKNHFSKKKKRKREKEKSSVFTAVAGKNFLIISTERKMEKFSQLFSLKNVPFRNINRGV